MKTTKLKIINDDTGEWDVDFYKDGRKCKAYEIDLTQCKIAKQYAAYGLLSNDLEFLLKWAIDLKNKIDSFEEKKLKGNKEKKFRLFKDKNNEICSEFFYHLLRLE